MQQAAYTMWPLLPLAAWLLLPPASRACGFGAGGGAGGDDGLSPFDLNGGRYTEPATTSSSSTTPRPPPESATPPTSPHDESAGVLQDLLGPIGEDGVGHLHGGGLAVTSADQLECTFDKRCCWHNVAYLDGLQYVLLIKELDKDREEVVFPDGGVPKPPCAALGARHEAKTVYGMLASCPIVCAQGSGTLEFEHAESRGVELDVCTLPLNTKEFNHCEQVQPGAKSATVIPPVGQPFQIVIVSSSFTRGGASLIDTIKYDGQLCDDPLTPAPDGGEGKGAEETAPPHVTAITEEPGERVDEGDEACNAVQCDWVLPDGQTDSMCGWSALDREHAAAVGLPTEGMRPRFDRSSPEHYPAGAGVLHPPLGPRTYVGGVLRSFEAVALRSAEFRADRNVKVEFDYFEATDGIQLRACYDSPDAKNCKDISKFGVRPKDIAWRRGKFTVKKSKKKTRTMYLVATNEQENRIGLIAIGPITVKGCGPVDHAKAEGLRSAGATESPTDYQYYNYFDDELKGA